MPGRQQAATAVAIPGGSAGSARSRARGARRASLRALAARLFALVVLMGAVAGLAALVGYVSGRGQRVDVAGATARAYAAGQVAGASSAADAARVEGARGAMPTARAGSPSRVITGPSAEMRAQLRRAYAAGRRDARAAGASVLGNFGGGWAIGRWYLVRFSSDGGRPTVTSRFGPLAQGQGYVACQGGAEMCPVPRR